MAQSSANPLFERFLKELQREAQASHADRLVLNYRKAIRSFQKYPAPLYSGEQAMVLDGVGKFIAKKLADKFDEYRRKHPEASFEPDPHCRQPLVPVTPKKSTKRKRADSEDQENRADPNQPVESRADSESRDQTDEPKTKKKKTKTTKTTDSQETVPKSKPVKQYVPKVRSGAWALLLALHRHALITCSQPGHDTALSKTALIARAAPLADASFEPAPGMPFHATAWGGMATLEKHVLVSRDGRPARYSLTDQGRTLAEQLHALTPDVDTWRDSAEWQETPVKSVSAPSVTRVNHLLADLQQFERAQSQGGRSLTSDDTCQSDTLIEHVIEEVIIVLDNREIKNQKERSYLHDQLVKEGVTCQVRKLELGDVVWLGRTDRGAEVVLDHIIERKQIPDLCASIIDGRYKEQKFRLRRCGVRDVMYLVEGDINGYFQRPRPGGVKKETLLTALTSTAVSDGLRVVQTQTANETVKFLTRMTRVLTARHCGSHVHTTESDRLLSDKLKGLSQSLTTLHLTFEQFSECNTKSRDLTLTDVFAKQLMTLHGCSEDKAAAITAKYPTPLALIQAYDALSSSQQRADLLKDLKGPASSKRLGPVLSRLIYETYCIEQ